MDNGLLLDTNGSHTTSMAAAFAVAVPEETRTYVPFSNRQLWDTLQSVAHNRGLQLGIPEMGLADKDQQLFGSVEITNQDHLEDEVRLMLGFRNSYNKTMSVGVCFGSKVFVCSNMCFTGYTSENEDALGLVHHRHQTNVFDGIRERLENAMDKFDAFKHYQENFYNRLKEIKLKDSNAHDLIIRSVAAEAITPKDVMTVVNEWHKQSHCPDNDADMANWHKEFMPRTAWSLFNANTEVLKSLQSKNALKASKRSIKMNNFFHSTFMAN